MSAIYWFSGTGNSLYAARRLAAELTLPLHPMAAGVPSAAAGGRGETLGFVFPSYYGNLPRMVRSFVEALDIRPETRLFAVVTMGGVGQGSVASLASALKAKGRRLDYGRGLHMPANYVLKYNPADPETCEPALDRADSRLVRIAREMAAGVQSVKAFRFSTRKLYRQIESLDRKFAAHAACTGCGRCAALCPADNIVLKDGRPHWQGRCEHCVSCISWCPARAIQYGARTLSRRRYRNPKVRADELMV